MFKLIGCLFVITFMIGQTSLGSTAKIKKLEQELTNLKTALEKDYPESERRAGLERQVATAGVRRRGR